MYPSRIRPPSGSSSGGGPARKVCQKCEQTGHATWECKNPRPYKSRPTRFQTLSDPKLDRKIRQKQLAVQVSLAVHLPIKVQLLDSLFVLKVKIKVKVKVEVEVKVLLPLPLPLSLSTPFPVPLSIPLPVPFSNAAQQTATPSTIDQHLLLCISQSGP
ncbi:uncharacterized protein PFL1_04615 [Pseudozyma flocculosa PF-1]|uniref:CCHC-type domain-containing protein n=1 Tax=Pseudozyma flocculosa PF-1 TaxID=1277687 RepID=A0A061HBA5_9BASI|nr:uncharacterized protein PFL1_04615 [Pseudozyma flocculosa PF-1]EPQ27871.1 hypothetical protein PFL1_04615 [Pseudozyma flocculosa PF-1]